MPPLIVVTVGEPARTPEPELTARKNELCAEAVRRHGGEAVLLDASAPAGERQRLLAAMDGVLLAGGADIDPAMYGGAPTADRYERDRDELELAAWREAERRLLPVFGICRGLQAVNVFAGGRLIPDVPDHRGPSWGHGRPALCHPIRIVPGTRLAGLLDGAGAELEVNSFHHLAVGPAELAPGLRASAFAESDHGPLVEGLEASGERWLVAVQSHPERVDSTPPVFERLFAAFVEAARKTRPVRSER